MFNHLKVIVWLGFTIAPALGRLFLGLTWLDVIDRSVAVGLALIVLAFLERKEKGAQCGRR